MFISLKTKEIHGKPFTQSYMSMENALLLDKIKLVKLNGLKYLLQILTYLCFSGAKEWFGYLKTVVVLLKPCTKVEKSTALSSIPFNLVGD